MDVGGDAWTVQNGTGGDEDGEGEFVSVVVEDELAELNHGDHVTHAWSWEEDDGVLHLVFWLRWFCFWLCLNKVRGGSVSGIK